METAYIEVQKLSKTYSAKNGTVEALKEISLSIPQNEIFGIIGLSGAGKSTLVRCLNLLEKPDSGTVIINGEDLLTLSKEQLRIRRQKIGMIFQHFNLLEQQTVLENVCFPLEIREIPVKQRKEKALQLLKQVGLEDKAKAYPSQLSGGQKQRVAIARVLANDPDILLCDEATSALDPETTKTILNLLKEIHDTMGITIVIITHEMKVIQEICTQMAVLHKGSLQECGSAEEILKNPKSKAAKRLLMIKETEEETDYVG
ncbi:MAG: ATP-binding cassette domain-containing protein [Lachnospiraceae bacterium]|nr:ATP-binding cassette domain-containing protein [Lachnospiraceae bacterium]